MKKLAAPAFAVAIALLLSGCISMTPANYMVTPESKAELQKYAGSRIAVDAIDGPAEFSAMCRGVGNVRTPDNMAIGQFIAKGFNDELRFAGLHATNGVHLKGRVTRAEFSSSAALVNGWWELAVTLESSNGKSMDVSNRYDFEAGFVGASACNNTSLALGPAAQALVRKAVGDPGFAALIR
jgi:hypothetical protein